MSVTVFLSEQVFGYDSLSTKGGKVRVRIVTFLTVASLMLIFVSEQCVTAPSNYYSENCCGSIFTGAVTETADNQVTLTLTKGSRADRVTGLFESRCAIPMAMRELPG
jgi:hypothetical protein